MNTQNIISGWTSTLAETTGLFQKSFGHLHEHQLNYKPTPETWSIAQNIDHIIKINESYYPTFNALKKGIYPSSFLTKLGFLANMIGNMILKSVEPQRKSRMKTFPIWEPQESHISGNILTIFAEHQEKFSREIELLQPALEKSITISSPANKNVVYKLETAIEIIVTHEKRHYNQALEVLPLIKP